MVTASEFYDIPGQGQNIWGERERLDGAAEWGGGGGVEETEAASC